MNVAVVVGVAVQHDAISSAAVEQVQTLTSLPEVDEVHLFTQWCDREPPKCPTHVLGSPWELVRHPDFRRCNVAIFHWGIHFALFDAITLLGPPGPSPVVHFHNCTPPSLVDESHRENILRSIHQVHHVISMGVPLWTYSEFNRRTLIDWGAGEAQLDWVTFPIATPTPRARDRRRGLVRLLSVGRLVPAKGVHVLVDAMDMLPDSLLEQVHLRVVSSSTFSSEAYRRDLEERLNESRPLLTKSVEFCISPTEAELFEIYGQSDVVVSPSFHEGLCVPIIEGYAAGCRAIGTTAGNLPYVVFSPDPLVPPGDPGALAAAIEAVVGDLDVLEPSYHVRRHELVESFTPPRARDTLQRALAAMAR